MSGANFDLAVIGGGLNGLICATQVARRGRKVVVLEKNAEAGGLAAGHEFHPGFRTPGTLHDTSALRPWVVEELGLARHGLKLRKEAAPVFAPAPAGTGSRGLLLWPDARRAAEELAQLGGADAAGYAKFREFTARVAPFVRRVFDDMAPDVAAMSLPGLWDLGKKALALRMLGKDDMMELLRIPAMCVADWLNESLASDRLKAAMAQPALWCSYTGPWSPGTAANLLLAEAYAGPGVEGGPAALAAAVIKAAAAAGVEVRTGSRVRRVRVKDGRAEGVELEGGDFVPATKVAASVDPRTLFLDLLEPTALSLGFTHDVRAIRARGTTAKVHLALSSYPEFECRPGTKAETVRIGESLDGLERSFDPVKYRQMSADPMLEVHFPGVEGGGFAPGGQQTASVLVHFAPYNLEGGWTPAAKERLYRTVMDCLARYAPRIESLVVGREVLTPVDLAGRFGLSGGHLYHGEHAADQMVTRPLVECARYTTPVEGLYLCGGGAHPGGGLTGAPGAMAGRVIGG